MSNTHKNIIVGTIAIAIIGLIVFLIIQWDTRVLYTIGRGGYAYDSSAFRPTPAELRQAQQFGDSILPQLKRLGLITTVNRTEIETIITVSGTLWKKRSAFFKKSFVDQLLVYNRVNGFAVNTRIIDAASNEVYAVITPPDRKDIY